ncbi:hypothetical protein [Leifsonia sp. Root4]|uniref:hypothetical protein n=1 Tax=Leifsonia sp. Root4 TaxID=1736525 RepID=UPI0012F8B95C|nr:hypothetical protein [Leifsonia sp. Root4]
MRSLRARVVRVMLGALVVASLAGCAASPVPAPTAPATPDAAAPLFASDEEALAAAEEAYGAYQAAFDSVSASGGAEVDALETVASGVALERARSSAADLLAAGARGIGDTSFSIHKVQSMEYASPAETRIALYVCDDVSGADLLDAKGDSLVLPDRPTLVPFEIVLAATERGLLILAEKNFWAGESYCSG